MNLTIPGVEKRFQSRYERLVQEHSRHADAVAAGPRWPDRHIPLPEPNFFLPLPSER
jgi:hypothetical protein